MTTPAPAPEPAQTAPVPSGSPLARAVHWAEQHLIPRLKTVESSATRIARTAELLAAIAEKADPALAAQLGPIVTEIEAVAAVLAAL